MDGLATIVYMVVMVLLVGTLVYLAWQIIMLALGPILVILGIFAVLVLLANIFA